MNGKSALLMCIEKGCKTGDHKCSQGSIIDDVVRQVKGESVGWSESQKEAIRTLIMDIAEAGWRAKDESKVGWLLPIVDKALAELEAITKGEQ